MTTVHGTMATDRPERYAKQLVSHWSERGPISEDAGVVVQRWETGQVLVLRAVEGLLEVEITVPEGDDAARFAQTVKEHLERFGPRDEVNLVWQV